MLSRAKNTASTVGFYRGNKTGTYEKQALGKPDVFVLLEQQRNHRTNPADQVLYLGLGVAQTTGTWM